MAAPLSRQATQLLSHQDVLQILPALRMTDLIGRLQKSGSDADAVEVHRLLLRCNTLMGQDSRQGFTLALELLRALPWQDVSAQAPLWISSGIKQLRFAVKPALSLLDALLGPSTRDKPEYSRSVVGPNLSKYATALMSVGESCDNLDELAAILESLTSQVHMHPTAYRTFAPRLHNLCSVILFERGVLIKHATALLSVLHLTGKGAPAQGQLWATTIESVLQEAEATWYICSSSFEIQTQAHSSSSTAHALMEPLPADPLKALTAAHDRFSLLLGQAPVPGVIPCLLSEATFTPVPIVVGKLFSLAFAILSLSSTSPARSDPPADASLHAAQVAHLPKTQCAAVGLLANLHLATTSKQVFSSRSIETVSHLLRLIESTHSSPALRCIAMKALAMLDIHLDPQSRVLLRASRTSMAQIARALSHPPNSAHATATGSRGRNTKSNKRGRMYESDELVASSLDRRGPVRLNDDERAMCIAAISYLPSLYEPLTTYVTAEHHDLAHTSALLLSAVVEVALTEDLELCSAALIALAKIVRCSRGSMLALLTARTSIFASSALNDARTRHAGTLLRNALEEALNPRLPLTLSLKLQKEDGMPTSWSNMAGEEGEPPLKLAKVEVEEQPGGKEEEALTRVLGISTSSKSVAEILEQPTRAEDNVGQNSMRTASSNALSMVAHATTAPPAAHTPALSSPNLTPTKASFSPDPVKPVRRPSTPRIGSPAATNGNPMGINGANPERKSGAFGSPSRNSPTPTPRITSPLTATSTQSQSQLGVEEADVMNDDSDDEGIPDLDLRSSDEESEG